MLRAALPLALITLALAGCDVTKDPANDTVAVEYDANEARAAGQVVKDTAENVASDIGQDVKREGEKLGDVADRVQVKDSDDRSPDAKAEPANSN